MTTSKTSTYKCFFVSFLCKLIGAIPFGWFPPIVHLSHVLLRLLNHHVYFTGCSRCRAIICNAFHVWEIKFFLVLGHQEVSSWCLQRRNDLNKFFLIKRLELSNHNHLLPMIVRFMMHCIRLYFVESQLPLPAPPFATKCVAKGNLHVVIA